MDDQAYLRNFAKRSLEALGYRVETAKDGTEAIEACRLAMESGNPFDVIVLDLIVQGGMGGAEAVREILAFAPDIRAVAASGYSTSGALFDPKAHGFFSALSKPYTIQSLRAAVDKALR
jgi:CheY-like chemotaxis protein